MATPDFTGDFDGDTALVCAQWATVAQVQALDAKYELLDSQKVSDALWAASDLLYLLTAQAFPGVCTETVRPCCRTYAETMPSWAGGDYVAPGDGGWGGYGSSGWSWRTGWGCCGGAGPGGCHCTGRSAVSLGRFPLIDITQVKIDGVALAPTRYWIEGYRYLVRLPDSGTTQETWPCTQRLDLPDTAEDTWSVTFTYGHAPPPGGVLAAAQLAGEVALDLDGCDDCSLGDAVTSVTRQGVTVEAVLPAAELMDQLPSLARAWVKSVNPLGLRRQASVWSPDLGRPAVKTDT